MVEYVLLLMVTIMVVFGVVYQFNDAFRNWAKGYLGDYTACLLETGELPAIGGTGGTSSACADMFKTFSLTEGRPYNSDGSDGSGGGGGGTGPGGDDEDPDGRNGQGTDGSGANYGGSRRRVGSGFGSDGRYGRNNNNGGSDSAAARKPRNVYTGSTEDSLASSGIGQNRSGSSSRQRMLEGGFYLARDSRPPEQVERAPAKISEGGRTERTTRMLIKRRLKTESQVAPDTPLTFGDYLRYLLIAAIIIALVIVLGSQMAQISDSE